MFIVVYTNIYGDKETSGTLNKNIKEAEDENFCLKELSGIKDGKIYELKPIQK